MTDFSYIIYDAANIPICGNNETEIYGPQWGYSVEGMSANNLAGPIFMKKQLVIDECNWILDDEAKNDKSLNPTDKNVLAILQYMADQTKIREDGFFYVFINKSDKVKNTLIGTLAEMGFKADYTTVMRAIQKLWRLRYIDYNRGFYNVNTNSGKWPEFRILKGTISAIDVVSSTCSDIATTEMSTGNNGNCNNQITDEISSTCSDIATTNTILKTKLKHNYTKGTYSYSDLWLEKIDSNESDIWRVEDTTFVGDSDKSIDLKSYLDDNVCNGNVMGDLLEWAIDNGWFTCSTQVDRVIDATRENCSLVALNADHYKKLFKRYEEKAERERLAKIIHA